ncbi:hypothetical protein GALL_279090 [mine drainage metagenome]|uniref:Uncharacterized protein n=1 Tax=mine drainage metagenome TaxID=410659 RepID=A0A1J5R2I7_9ZZZZ
MTLRAWKTVDQRKRLDAEFDLHSELAAKI